jgi:hypothetical protein
MRIKGIRILSAIKISSVLGAVLGLVISLGSVLFTVFDELDGSRVSAGAVGAIAGATLGSTLAFTCFGVIASVCAVFLYNVVAAIVGGIEVDIE